MSRNFHITDHIAKKVLGAKVNTEPFKFFVVKNLIPNKYYQVLIKNLPELKFYEPLMHRHTLIKGKPTRFELSLSHKNGLSTLSDFFPGSTIPIEIIGVLRSEWFKNLVLEKFESSLDVTPYLHLYKDMAGFNLPPHTDIVEKAITFGWYLPGDCKHSESGLKLFRKKGLEFEAFWTIPYEPNTAFAFLRSDSSWHGATHHPCVSYDRNSLFITFYKKKYYTDGHLLVDDPNVERKEINIDEC